MPSEHSADVKFEIGHVLFIDIVGYSKLLINQQSEQIQKLKEIVRGTEQVCLAEAEGKLLRLPTGDGGALVFRNNLEAPVLCALEVAKALKSHPEIRVRMGIHSGPVNEVVDLNEQSNIAGAGINMAQRVMDCGDAGHILVSKRVADDLEHYAKWRSQLHELGECEVKHGLRISLLNLFSDEVGNPELPEKFRKAKKQTKPAAAGRGEELWLAVLPFKSSGDVEIESFANGLGEEITTGLSRFRYLSVVAGASAARLKEETEDERTLGARLGARYVLQGSIRKGGSSIRVTAQLVDVQTGTQLWAETYNRDLQASTIFDAQDDIAARIVATVADSYGVLVHSLREATEQKDDADFTPAEWQFQWFAYREQITPSNHAALRSRLERAAKSDNRPSDLWACLAQICVDEYAFGWQDDATSLDRALVAARRGVELDRANQFAMVALAQTHFFRQDLAAFGPAAERAMALNPLNTDALGILGLEIVHTGEFERGTAIVRRAMELNPNHAGWMHFAPLWDHFHKREYEQALERANRVDVPGLFWPFLVMASACGHLSRRAEAKAAVRDLLALDPDFATHARANIGTWHFASGLMEPILDGLRKAGLSIPENGSSDSPKRNPQPRRDIKGATAAKSVAVLPFVNLSADKADEYLSDGMTEELINALAKVPGLRVPGRTSCFAFKGKSEADIFRKVGDQLHVETVLEGSVRKAGDKLRVTAQLINVNDGYHLWSKDYDGDVRDIFAFQSNVAQRVVEALQINLGVEEARALTKKSTENPEAHRLYLLGRYEFGKYSEAGWTSSIRYYEQALKLDPNYALAYCGLADTYAYMGGVVMPSREAVVKEKEFAQRALQLEPQLAEAHLSLAAAFAGAFDWQDAQAEFDRAIELNPNLAWAYEIYAWYLGGVGRLDDAIANDKKAITLDPLNSFFQAALAYFLYHARRYDDAIVQIKKTLELDPASTLAHHLLGCCLLWKGDTAGAIAEFQRSKIMVAGAWYQGLLGYAYAISGDRPKAEQILRELEEMAKRQYVSTTAFADIYLGLGEKEKALDWLERSYQDQESACWYLKVDPIYDSVRNEPRFQALVQEIFGSNR